MRNFLLSRLRQKSWLPVGFVGLFALVGVVALLASHAATPYANVETENGTLCGSASLQSDTNVSGGQYVQFGTVASPPTGTTFTPYGSKILGVDAYDVNDPELQQLNAGSERIELDLPDNNAVVNNSPFGDPSYYGSTGSWIDRLTTDHMVPLALLNTYENISSSCTSIYNNPQVWANQVVTWCKQYCSGGSFYNTTDGKTNANPAYAPKLLEMMNEPYGSWYRNGAVPPQSYANMLVATRTALNNAGLSNIGILGAGADQYSAGDSWTTGVYGGGDSGKPLTAAYNSIQGMTVHPYGPAPSPAPLLPATASLSGAQCTGSPCTGGNSWDLVYYLHQQYNLDMYVTEDGWCTTAPPSTVCGDSGNIPEAQKDANIQGAISQLATVSWIKGLWYFNLTPYSGNTYGLDNADGSQTCAWQAFQKAAHSNGFSGLNTGADTSLICN